LRALSAARNAPGGLRSILLGGTGQASYDDDDDDDDATTAANHVDNVLLGRLLDALCAAGMLFQANGLLREALDLGVRPSATAVERLVRHGARAGRAAETAAAARAFRAAGGKPTLRTYTDLISSLSKRDLELSKREKRRARHAAAATGTTTTTTARRWQGTGAGAGAGASAGTAALSEATVDSSDASSSWTAVDVWLSLRAASSTDPSLRVDGAAYTAAVGAYMIAGRPDEANKLVREMNREKIDAGPRLYNTLIAAHGRAGDIEGVRAAERAMRAAGVRPNGATHGARVAAYARCGEIALAEKALDAGRADARAGNKPTVYAYTALVQALARSGRVDEARGWLDVMRADGVAPNAHTYSTIVDGLVRAGDAAAAESALREMKANGVEPTAVTYNTLLKSCVAGVTPADALRGDRDGSNSSTGSEAVERGDDGSNSIETTTDRDRPNPPPVTLIPIRPRWRGERRSLRTFGADADASAALNRARRVLESMRASGVSTTVVTYNTLIDACVSAGEPTEAMFGVLSALVAAGHRPDVVTYTTLLKHFSRAGDANAARWLAREMEADVAVAPDASAYNCLIDALVKAGEVAEAASCVRRMRGRGCAPDRRTYGALLDGFCRVGDVRSAAGLYDALMDSGPSGGASREWTYYARPANDDGDVVVEVRETVREARELVAPDARMRCSLVVACGRGVASATLSPKLGEEIVERVVRDVAREGGEKSAAEAADLRGRWKLESKGGGGTRSLKKRGRSARSSASSSSASARGGGDAFVGAVGPLDPRAGCPIPSSWGPRPRSKQDEERAAAAAAASASVPARRAPGADAEWSRGLEMWKHWLGLPSQYYDGRDDAPSSSSASGSLSPASDAVSDTVSDAVSDTAADTASAAEGINPNKKHYAKEEIAAAVATLRAAAARRYPDDPQTALRVALEAAEEGNARRIEDDEEEESGDGLERV